MENLCILVFSGLGPKVYKQMLNFVTYGQEGFSTVILNFITSHLALAYILAVSAVSIFSCLLT